MQIRGYFCLSAWYRHWMVSSNLLAWVNVVMMMLAMGERKKEESESMQVGADKICNACINSYNVWPCMSVFIWSLETYSRWSTLLQEESQRLGKLWISKIIIKISKRRFYQLPSKYFVAVNYGSQQERKMRRRILQKYEIANSD